MLIWRSSSSFLCHYYRHIHTCKSSRDFSKSPFSFAQVRCQFGLYYFTGSPEFYTFYSLLNSKCQMFIELFEWLILIVWCIHSYFHPCSILLNITGGWIDPRGHQAITGLTHRATLTFPPTGNLWVSSPNLLYMSFACRRKCTKANDYFQLFCLEKCPKTIKGHQKLF